MQIWKQKWMKWLVILVGPVIWVLLCQIIAADTDIGCALGPAVIFYFLLAVWAILNNPVAKAKNEAKREARLRAMQTLYIERPPTHISKTCSKCGRVVPTTAKTGQRCPHCGVVWNFERGARELVHKRCGKCKKLYSDQARAGQKCTNCGTVWSYEEGLRA